jgi:hypothetical protein
MDSNWQRTVIELVERLDGPLHLRFYGQPLMAAYLAIRDGIADARNGSPPYLRTICCDPAQRKPLLKKGIQSVAKLFFFAIVLEAIYQFIVFRWFYLGQALLVALFLAFIPYLLIRGPANRLAKWRIHRHAPRPHGYGVSR